MEQDTGRFNQIKILLIDDDEEDYLLTKKTLKQAKTLSTILEWVQDYRTGLKQCANETFDVILVDYKLGGKNGLDLIREAKKGGCTSPSILLTGVSDRKLGVKSIRKGAEDYLVKSDITPELLERSILYSIERYNMKMQEQELREKKALERSEKHFRSLIENSADGIALIDKDGSYVYVAPSIKKILGYTPEEALQMSQEDIIHPEDLEKKNEKTQEILGNPGENITVELRCQHKDGSWKWIENTVSNRLHDPDVHSYVLNFRDVTDRKKLEQLKDEFLSIASHELKTPLTTVKGYIQLLEKYFQKKNDSKALGYIHQSDRYVDKLNQLISDLLDISRIQSGRLRLNLEEVDIYPLLKKTTAVLQHLSSKHEISFSYSCQPTVVADKERIEQVITNLISNAIKYSPDDGRIQIELQCLDEVAQISVRDQGVGIPEEDQSRLFERFFRVKKTAKQYSGLGIGLYISHEIIVRHKGKMWVESEEGQGSTFYFTLPLHN